jgi:hypothetical protein
LQRRLLETERQFALVPVPPSTALPSFLHRFLEEEIPAPGELAGGLPALTIRRFPSHPPARERGLQKLSLAVALVAALLLFVISWWALPPQPDGSRPPARTDPLAARQAQRDQRLASARSPRERVEILSDLADKLHTEAVSLAGKADVENLAVLVRFYNELVHEDLIRHAQLLHVQERAAVIDVVATRLTHAESHLQRVLATEPPRFGSRSLRELAVAAREGHDRLRALLPS